MTLAAARKQSPDSASKAKRDGARSAQTNPLQRRGGFPVPFIQRKPTCACGGGRPRCKEHSAQEGLEIGQLQDGYEQEADHVAEQMMRMPEPQLQRSCPCGGECPRCKTEHPDEEHEHLQTKRLQAANLDQTAVPPIVHEVLASPGQPLDPATRGFMELRFGHDFSRVRVHTDERAGASARAVNAHAYTVGENVVFANGHFSPRSTEGRRLLAHELAHVVQQKQGKQQLQRWASCKVARPSLEDCPPRQPGEAQRARSGPMVFRRKLVVPPSLSGPVSGAEGVLIANFDIGSAAIKPNLHQTLHWKGFLTKIERNRSRWKLLGFTDCQGEESLNIKLREHRAAAVFNILPKEVQPQITSYEGAPIYDCITENSNAADRTLNRSVAFILEYSVADFPSEVVTSSMRKEPRTQHCSKTQRDRLAVAFPAAEHMIKNAIAIIQDMEKGSEEEALFIKYFGKDAFSHKSHIRQGFEATLRQWKKRGPTYPYVCVKQGTGECTPGTQGYVESFGLPGWPWGPKGDIHICEDAFKLDDNRKLAAVLIHETSHMLDWTTTDEYCGMETNRGCSLDTEKAEDNADSYAQFAREAFERWP